MMQNSPAEYKGIQVKPLDSWFVRNFPKLKYPHGIYYPVDNVIYLHPKLDENERNKTLEHAYRHYLQFKNHPSLKKCYHYYFLPSFTNATFLTIIGLVFLLPKSEILNILGAIIIFLNFLVIAWLEYDADNYSGDKIKGYFYFLLWIEIGFLIIIGRWLTNQLVWFLMALSITVLGISNPLTLFLIAMDLLI